MEKQLIGKFIVDKRNLTSGDVGQIIQIKGPYYLIKWIRIENTSSVWSGHRIGGYAMYEHSKLMEAFVVVDSLSGVMAELI